MKKFMIVILLIFPLVSSADWWVTTVDVGKMGGVSIALDSLDEPHIAYTASFKEPSK